MSVYITPVTFEGKHITPSDDAAMIASSNTDGIMGGCALTKSGTTLTLAAGKILACGRICRVDEPKTFTVGSSGYSRLILTIDRSKENVDEQVALDVETAQTVSGFPALVQNDINNGGAEYQFVIALMNDGGIIWKCGRSHSRGYGVQVTLAANGWANNQQTVYVDGLLATSPAIVAYAPESQAAYEAAGVMPVLQGDGTITFQCTTVPTVAVKANILLY